MQAPDGVSSWMVSLGWADVRPLLDGVVPYRHPYGFLVFRLPLQYFPEWGIRVHLWPPAGERSKDADSYIVHSHGWDLVTRTVVGCVHHEVYELDDGQDALRYGSFSVTSAHGVGSSVLEPEGQSTGIRLVSRWDATPGENPLYIPAGEFHTTTSPNEDLWNSWSVTLVATEHVSGNESRVLGPKGGEPVVNQRASIDDPASILAVVDREYQQRVDRADEWTAFAFLVHSGRLLLARTSRYPHYWHPIGGQMESSDHTPLDTVRREVMEEVALTLDPKEVTPLGSLPRDEGEGRIYGWVSAVSDPASLVMQESEIHETRWMTLGEALSAESLSATKGFLGKIAEQRESLGLE